MSQSWRCFSPLARTRTPEPRRVQRCSPLLRWAMPSQRYTTSSRPVPTSTRGKGRAKPQLRLRLNSQKSTLRKRVWEDFCEERQSRKANYPAPRFSGQTPCREPTHQFLRTAPLLLAVVLPFWCGEGGDKREEGFWCHDPAPVAPRRHCAQKGRGVTAHECSIGRGFCQINSGSEAAAVCWRCHPSRV